jgi:hypothetical protein
MLVDDMQVAAEDHHIETEFIRKSPLIIVSIEQIGCDHRIESGIGYCHAQTRGVVLPSIGIRLFGEVINSHMRGHISPRLGPCLP